MKNASLLSPGLCKSGLRRYWPLWLAAFVALLLLFVLPAYVSMPMAINEADGLVPQADLLEGFWSIFRFEAWFYAFVGSVVVALALNEHLFDSRAATFMGSLPLRRPVVFSSTYASGLLVLAALPALASLCLLPLRLTLGSAFSLAYVGEWLFVAVTLSFVFYSFAQLSCQVSGTRTVALIIYMVIGFLAVCLEVAVRLLVSALVYGLGADELRYDWLSPAARLAGRMLSPVLVGSTGGSMALSDIVPYLLVSCFATLGSAWLFSRRNLESAGDGVLFAPLRKVLKYLAGISLALLFGSVYRILSVSDGMSGLPMATGQVLILVVLLAIGAFLGALFADMIMARSTHVLGTCWRDGLVLMCVMAAFVGVCKADLFRLGSYVPDPSEVEKVTLESDYGSDELTISSPENVTATCALQQRLIAYGGAGDPNNTYFTIHLTYQLKGGRTVKRSYPVVTYFPLALTSDGEDSQLISAYAQIADSEEGRAVRFADVLNPKRAVSVEIERALADGSYTSITLSGEEATDFMEHALYPDLMEEKAGELFDGMTDDYYESDTIYDGSAYVTMPQSLEGGNEYQEYLIQEQFSEKRTPHMLAWLRAHYPDFELIEVTNELVSE